MHFQSKNSVTAVHESLQFCAGAGVEESLMVTHSIEVNLNFHLVNSVECGIF